MNVEYILEELPASIYIGEKLYILEIYKGYYFQGASALWSVGYCLEGEDIGRYGFKEERVKRGSLETALKELKKMAIR